MKRPDKKMPLDELLAHCCDNNSPRWQDAWAEFLERYKMYIYKIVSKRCKSWNVTRLNMQFSEVVNDIVTDIFILLVENNGKALSSYRGGTNEKMFLGWLATVSDRMATRHLKRYFTRIIMDEEMEDFRGKVLALNESARWELYESLVDEIRSLTGSHRRLVERDIHLFMLYNWADFSESMIKSLPYFRNMGGRVLDNVVNRIRKALRSSASDLA
jgi:hypothetical protein